MHKEVMSQWAGQPPRPPCADYTVVTGSGWTPTTVKLHVPLRKNNFAQAFGAVLLGAIKSGLCAFVERLLQQRACSLNLCPTLVNSSEINSHNSLFLSGLRNNNTAFQHLLFIDL